MNLGDLGIFLPNLTPVIYFHVGPVGGRPHVFFMLSWWAVLRENPNINNLV